MSDEDRISLNAGGVASQIDHLLNLGQVERAQSLAMDFIARDPDNPAGHLALAVIPLNRDKPLEALNVIQNSLQKNPDNDYAHKVHADILFALGRFADAEISVRRAIEIDPSYVEYYARYAHFLSVCDYDREALQFAEQALSMDPDSAGLHDLRAHLLLFVHPSHWPVSEEAVRTALRINPNSSESHAILGIVLTRGNNKTKAEAAFREALRLNPHSPLAIMGLSELVKGKYFWYRPMLAFGQLMSRLGKDGQIGVIFALWALYVGIQAVIPPEYDGTSNALTFVYLGFCLYTWFAEPITRGLLRRVYPWLE
jgi:tetratricopeptide (TPR) repeat protein